jgi:hypothetical protein
VSGQNHGIVDEFSAFLANMAHNIRDNTKFHKSSGHYDDATRSGQASIMALSLPVGASSGRQATLITRPFRNSDKLRPTLHKLGYSLSQ